MPTPLRVSPSRLARFFFLECERMLRFSATPKGRREAEGVPAQDERSSVVTDAILEGGYVWEERVLLDLAERAIVGPEVEGAQLRDRVLPYDQLLDRLRKPEPGRLIYQAHLVPPPAFYARYGLDPSEIAFSPCRPDLLEVRIEDGTSKLWVIDVKATDAVRFSHRAQAAFYALLLRSVLEEEGIDSIAVDLETCGIWLYGREAPELCDLASLIGPLEAFLRNELPRILLQPADRARWSMFFRCEWCDYYSHCRQEAEERRDVSLIPYVPPEAKRFLEGLTEPADTLGGLKGLLRGGEAQALFRDCASLAGRHDALRTQVEALESGAPVSTGGSSIALSRGQKVGIVLTLQRDPITGGVFAAGTLVRAGEEVGHLRGAWTCVAEESGPEGIGRVRRSFICHMESLLRTVHDYNAGRDWREQLSLQCFVFDGYERSLLDQLLLEALQEEDHDLAERALSLFFHFQSERLTQSESHPGAQVPFPLVVVTEVIRQTIALPVHVAYRLADVSAALEPDSYGTVYRDQERFAFPLSNRIRSDPMFKAWQDGSDEVVAAARRDTADELERRMRATFSTLSGLIQRVGDRLFAYAPKFQLPARDRFRHGTLSRLAFMTRYEQLLAYLGTRATRARSRTERLDTGTGLKVTLTGLLEEGRRPRWRADVAPESAHVLVETGGFGRWLLSEDSPEGDREQMRFMDFQYRRAFKPPRRIKVSFADIVAADRAEGQLEVSLTIGRDAPTPEAGKSYLLHQRFTDWSSQKVLDALAMLDGQDPCAFVDLVERPHESLEARRRPEALHGDRLSLAMSQFGFTDSQASAMQRILDSSFQLVWGPPGTGKTHFLGLLVCVLAGAKRQEDSGLSVLVSGFTHAAIENCLRKISALAAAHADRVPELQITKLDGWRGQSRPAQVAELSGDPREDPGASDFQVVGATVYSIHKHLEDPFDLVILDEGSQLRVAEAGIPAGRVHERGRLVVAGDDKQLGPIFTGSYPEAAPGEPALFSSIFDCLRSRDLGRDLYTAQLLECFRLNETLCRFPAQLLYGADYRPVSDQVASQRIRIAEEPLAPEWLELCLDPDFALVLLILEGVPALAENQEEARLVSELSCALRARLQDQEGGEFEDDRSFWSRGLFVVSPHHAQIRAIRAHLHEAREWSYPPFVDTVDKMQGQESEAVVVSYGVADSDYALREGEFIYSPNRLNVSITRGRAKAIVCLPAPLLTPPITAFAREDVLEGLSMMLRLREFALSNGEERVFDLPRPGAKLRVIRARAAQREES